MSEDFVNVRDQDVFEPVSELAGNFEITFNAKSPKLDTYEPYMDQVVLTIGKTGRANRLSFDQLDSESIEELIEALEKVKNQVESIEKDQMSEEDDSDAEKNDLRKVKDIVDDLADDYDDSVSLEKVLDKAEEDMDRDKASDIIKRLKSEGELFSKKQGEISKI